MARVAAILKTPSPTQADPARAIVMRVIDRIAPRVTGRAEIDKGRWLRILLRYMSLFEPTVDQVVSASARSDSYAGMIAEFVRKSKGTAVENLSDIDDIRRAIKRENRLVRIRREDGSYVAKREMDCSALELEALADQYQKRIDGLARRASYYRQLAREMRQASFDVASDPLRKLLG